MGKVLGAKVHQAKGVTQDVFYQPFTDIDRKKIQAAFWLLA